MHKGRRWFLAAGGSSAIALAVALASRRAARAAGGESEVSIEQFAANGHSLGTEHVAKVVKSDADWHAQLSALAYEVTRREGTEAAFSGDYANHAEGLYRCICCDTALFDSKTKYDSGTGWPSFYRAISRYNVSEHRDLSFAMVRTAIACRRCDAHLGHVFDDGPRPTGLRYCMNSVALHFVALSA